MPGANDPKWNWLFTRQYTSDYETEDEVDSLPGPIDGSDGEGAQQRVSSKRRKVWASRRSDYRTGEASPFI